MSEMIEVNYTAAPWRVIPRGERGTYHIPVALEHELEAAMGDGRDGYSVSLANARLIAAAPEMADALLILFGVNEMGVGLTLSQRLRLCQSALETALGYKLAADPIP